MVQKFSRRYEPSFPDECGGGACRSKEDIRRFEHYCHFPAFKRQFCGHTRFVEMLVRIGCSCTHECYKLLSRLSSTDDENSLAIIRAAIRGNRLYGFKDLIQVGSELGRMEDNPTKLRFVCGWLGYFRRYFRVAASLRNASDSDWRLDGFKVCTTYSSC